MNQLDTIKYFDQWLIYLGFNTTSFPPIELLYYRDDNRDPDSLRGANLVLFEKMDGVSQPEQLKTRCSILFSKCLPFFKKKVRGENFFAFIIFPMYVENTKLVNYVTSTRPASNSVIGAYIPIVMDLSCKSNHFFNPSFSHTSSTSNKLGNQIELLFTPPLRAPVDIPESISKLINRLRKSAKTRCELSQKEYATVNIGNLKAYSRQWLYEGSLNLDKEADRKLLYSWYLSEFLHLIEKQSPNSKTELSDVLSITSFLSLEQFGNDIIEGLARSMVGSFQKGFDQSLREINSSNLRKKLHKNQSIISLSFCHGCDKVVQLSADGQCTRSGFHKVNPPSYFEVNETEAIQIFQTNGRL